MLYRCAALAAAFTMLFAAAPARAAGTEAVATTIVAELERNADENAAASTPPRIIDGAIPERDVLDGLTDATGTVMIAISLDASGRLLASRIIATSGKASLDRSALAAIRSSRYAAGSRAGRTVAGSYAVAVVFDSQE